MPECSGKKPERGVRELDTGHGNVVGNTRSCVCSLVLAERTGPDRLNLFQTGALGWAGGMARLGGEPRSKENKLERHLKQRGVRV